MILQHTIHIPRDSDKEIRTGAECVERSRKCSVTFIGIRNTVACQPWVVDSSSISGTTHSKTQEIIGILSSYISCSIVLGCPEIIVITVDCGWSYLRFKGVTE